MRGQSAASVLLQVSPCLPTTLISTPVCPRPGTNAIWSARISKVTGVSLPGAPGIVVGHNQQVAWGMTASMVDTQDIFMERLADDGSPRYRVRNAWRQGEVVHEVISVKGKREPEHEQVLVTPHGPVVLRDTEDATLGYALKSTLLQPGSVLKATRGLLQASSVQEAQEALAHWTAPALNFVLADVHGNIGHQLAGRLPRREPDSGVVPALGWEQQREWRGNLPPEDNPALLNPLEGYVVNANNKVTSSGEPHIAGEWVDGYRAQRIADLLLARPRHGVADFQAMHQDVLSLPALQLIHMLVDAEPLSQAANQGMEMLLRWDARIERDSPQAALYEAVRQKLHQNLLRPVLGARVQDYFGVQVHPLGASSAYQFRGGSMLFRLAERLRSSDKDAWHRLLTQSFEEAFADLYYTLGPNMQSWSWGGLHTLTFRHPLGALPVVGRLLNRGPYPLRGDTDTVHQASFPAGESFEANRWIPGFRYVADTSDWDRSVVINVPGQSGQVGSPHYDDQIEMWLRGEYRPMLFSRAAVEAGGAVLATVPAGAAVAAGRFLPARTVAFFGCAATVLEGQFSWSAQMVHMGRSALHTCRPCSMRWTWKRYASSGLTASSRMAWAASAVTLGPIRPSRLAIRCTWVSTGMHGKPREKSSTQRAVFGPTPSSVVSQAKASVKGNDFKNARS